MFQKTVKKIDKHSLDQKSLSLHFVAKEFYSSVHPRVQFEILAKQLKRFYL